MTNDIEERKRLTFEQAEGVEPLPSQLQLREISPKLRAVLWSYIHGVLQKSTEHVDYGQPYIDKPWSVILKGMHVYRDHKMADEFSAEAKHIVRSIRQIFETGDYVACFGWIEFVLKHPACPHDFPNQIEAIFKYAQAAYRVIDKKIICPISSDTEHSTLVRAFADVSKKEFHGARSHLRNAATQLAAGEFADSVRESVHAVESICRTLDPSADLSKALSKLEQTISIHGAMKRGFVSLYGYASDEQGIRHALLEAGKSKVDEADALFMIGACAAFVSYLINKARIAGLVLS